jgi:type I restriction enzyme S subunit
MVETMKQTELGNIPNDWDIKTLGDVGDVKMCRRVFNQETKSQGPIPFYKIGTFGKQPDAYINIELYNSYRRRFSYPKKGEILISAAGTIGRTWIYDGKPAYFQDSNIVWIDNNETIVSNDFLNHVLQVVKYSTEGGTIQRLYNSILKSTKFLCPPTETEQTAIATALNDTDALLEQLGQLLTKKRNIKMGAMQELLRPKIGWEEKFIPEVINRNNGIKIGPFGSALKKELLVASGYKVYGQENVFERDMNVGTRYINREHFTKLRSCELNKGDFIISMMGTIGKCMIVPPKFEQGIMDSHLIRLRLNDELIDANYLLHYFSSSVLLNQVNTFSVGGIMAGLSSAIIKQISIPLPPRKEIQTQIAQILTDMDNEIQGLESKLEKYKMLKQGMMQSLLTGKIRLV